VAATEVEAEAEIVEENEEKEGQEVICVITVTKMAIMLKIVQNHQRKGSHDFKMVDVLFAMKKDIRKLIVRLDVVVAVAENTVEVEVHPNEEVEVLEVDPEATLIQGEIDLEDNSAKETRMQVVKEVEKNQ